MLRRPSATDPGIRGPKRFSWLKFEPHPLLQSCKGRGAVSSRGGVIEAKIVDASGRGAEVMLEAFELEPAQEAEFFYENGLLRSRRPKACKLRRSDS